MDPAGASPALAAGWPPAWVLAHRYRLAATAPRHGWPPVKIAGVDDEVLATCGTIDPAGHQALPVGGYTHT